MQAPDPIESALARLMPSAMSVAGQRSIEDMLDELAGASSPPARRWRYPAIGFAAAAAMTVVASLSFFGPAASVQSPVGNSAHAMTPHGVEWVEQSSRVESMDDGGWVTAGDGTPMQAVRVRVVGENMLRDEETGYTVRVSEPRDELLLMPVSSF